MTEHNSEEMRGREKRREEMKPPKGSQQKFGLGVLRFRTQINETQCAKISSSLSTEQMNAFADIFMPLQGLYVF